MPAPYPRREPIQGMSRAVNRGARGMSGGKFAGLSRVNRSTPDTETTGPAAASTFARSYWKLTRTTSQSFGNGLSMTWTGQSSSGDTSWHGTGPTTSVPSVSVTQPYSVFLYMLTNVTPGTVHPEIQWNGPAVAVPFLQTGASAWVARGSAVLAPDVTSLASFVVMGAGTTADITITSAELWIFPV